MEYLDHPKVIILYFGSPKKLKNMMDPLKGHMKLSLL